MERRRSRWVCGVLVAAWLGLVAHADAAQAAGFSQTAHVASRFGEASFDVIVLRPMSAMALAVGSVFFVASVPFVAPFGGGRFEGVRSAWSAFVYAPYEYTVLRPLGDF